jgi:IMP dehydrogenase
MGYCGSKTFQPYRKRDVLFITASGINESHPHNVTITKESQLLKIITE